MGECNCSLLFGLKKKILEWCFLATPCGCQFVSDRQREDIMAVATGLEIENKIKTNLFSVSQKQQQKNDLQDFFSSLVFRFVYMTLYQLGKSFLISKDSPLRFGLWVFLLLLSWPLLRLKSYKGIYLLLSVKYFPISARY